jgi:hypothetical protein
MKVKEKMVFLEFAPPGDGPEMAFKAGVIAVLGWYPVRSRRRPREGRSLSVSPELPASGALFSVLARA